MKKSTKLAHIHHKMRTVSLFGTAIFIAAVSIQAVLTGTIVWHFRSFASAGMINTGEVIAMLVLAGLLPPLAAFMIGERSTNARSRYEHFYNGVLFVFMTLWLSMFLAYYLAPWLPDFNVPYVADAYNQLWPVIIALVVAIVIGIEYGRQRHQKLLHEYLPFKIALVVPLGALIVGSAWEAFAQLVSPIPSVYGLVVIVPFILQVSIFAVSYRLSTERSAGNKLAEASICASIGFFGVMAASQVPLFGFGIATSILVPSVIGVVVWLAFLYFYFYRRTDRLQ